MNKDPEITRALLEANPHIAALVYAFVLLIFVLFFSFFCLWIIAYLRWQRGSAILDVAPWKPRSWGLIDVLLVLGMAFLGQAILIPAWSKFAGIDLRKMVDNDSISLSVMAVGSLSYLIAMLLGVGWLIVRYAADMKHIGLSLKRFFPNLGLGLAAAAMSLPIVALISAVISTGLKAEYDHPLINELRKEGTLSAYLLAVFCAVCVAPLVEEFFFRVMLQGWMESLPWSIKGWWWLLGSSSQPSPALVGAGEAALPTSDNMAVGIQPPIVQPAVATNPAALNPYDATSSVSPGSFAGTADETTLNPATPPIWPSLVVGALFGLAHRDYGLSFIPLIVLGIVLGLLYRAKHSIWPCFILHFTLNSISMGSLGIALLVQSAK